MNVVETVKQVAVRTFLNALADAPDSNGTFKMLRSVKVGDTVKPLLLVGNAHGKHEDGHCIAVLNPDECLLDQIKAGVGYNHMLKWIVAKKCDLAIDVWVDAYKENGISFISKYKARKQQPAKFVVA